MGLQMRKGSRWWYGRWKANGKTHTANLAVRIAGNRPRSLTERGDQPFEQSKFRAEQELQRMKDAADKRVRSEELVQKLHVLRTGDRIHTVKLAEIKNLWKNMPRSRSLSDSYLNQGLRMLTRFEEYMAERHPTATEMLDVTELMAEEFMEAEWGRGVTPQTYNSVLSLVKGVFSRFGKRASLQSNPFADIPRRAEEPVLRQPFTENQLGAILDACRDDDFIRPVIVVAMSTAMRRGDCCRLRWESVDMGKQLLRVKTSKTGQVVWIPIFQLLYNELLRQCPKATGFVLPEQEKMYSSHPDGITVRVMEVLSMAGFSRGNAGSTNRLCRNLHPCIASDEERVAIRRVIETSSVASENRRIGMMRVAELYAAGKTVPEVQGITGLSRGTVSNYLNEIERLLARPFIRGKYRLAEVTPVAVPPECVTEVKRARGLRAASIRDFHSFRTTWVTLALMAGIPMEVVRLVTGHRTVDVVLKHYFRPDFENIRGLFERRMPDILTAGRSLAGSEKTSSDIIRDATPENAWWTIQQLRRMEESQSAPAQLLRLPAHGNSDGPVPAESIPRLSLSEPLP